METPDDVLAARLAEIDARLAAAAELDAEVARIEAALVTARTSARAARDPQLAPLRARIVATMAALATGSEPVEVTDYANRTLPGVVVGESAARVSVMTEQGCFIFVRDSGKGFGEGRGYRIPGRGAHDHR